MAGQWIRWEKGLQQKPEVSQISTATGLDPFSVAARLMVVWSWADDNTINGVMDGAMRTQVDMIAMHPGFAEAMEHTRPHPWLLVDETGITFPKYEKHNGLGAKKRMQDAERKRTWRDSIRHPPSRPPVRPRDIHGT